MDIYFYPNFSLEGHLHREIFSRLVTHIFTADEIFENICFKKKSLIEPHLEISYSNATFF